MSIVKIVRDSSIPDTAGEAIAVAEACSMSSSDGLIYLACAAAGLEEMPVVGVAETSVAAGDEVELKRFATVDSPPRDGALNPGGPVYLSNTPGAVAAAAGDTAHIVGIAISATRYFIDPEIIAQQTQH